MTTISKETSSIFQNVLRFIPTIHYDEPKIITIRMNPALRYLLPSVAGLSAFDDFEEFKGNFLK